MTTTSERSKLGFWILVGLLAASGVSMALIAVFGWFDSAAFDLVWRVFLADVYIICSFAAQHAWLRRTIWVGAGITFVAGLVNVFWRYTSFYRPYTWNEHEVWGDPSTGWDRWQGIESDIEMACHLLLVCAIVLGFVSFAYRWIVTERVLKAFYWFTFIAGATASLLGAFMLVGYWRFWQDYEELQQARLALFILALTGAAIVTIGGFVQRKAMLARVKEEPVVLGSMTAGTSPTIGVGAGGGEVIHPDEMRALVRQYVDEYLAEKEPPR